MRVLLWTGTVVSGAMADTVSPRHGFSLARLLRRSSHPGGNRPLKRNRREQWPTPCRGLSATVVTNWLAPNPQSQVPLGVGHNQSNVGGCYSHQVGNPLCLARLGRRH